MDKEVAHFFWHGTMGNLEKACIKSFVSKGFDVNLWSYTGIELNDVTSRDASEIMPVEFLYKYDQYFPKDSNKTKEQCSIAAFSDAFRYNVLNKYDGWWFDTDCYCLKSQDEFKILKQNRTIVTCMEIENTLTCQALWANDYGKRLLLEKLNGITAQTNYRLTSWGQLGPRMVTEVVLDNRLQDDVLPIDFFSSIHGHEAELYLSQDKIKLAKQHIKDAYLVHIWTFNFKDHRNNPPAGTLLHEFINGTYFNDEIQAEYVKTRGQIQLDRFVKVAYLYNRLLNRGADLNGLLHYINSNKSIEQIESIFKSSEEYISLQRH